MSLFICVLGPVATWRSIRGLNTFNPKTHSGKEWLVAGLIMGIIGDLAVLGLILLFMGYR